MKRYVKIAPFFASAPPEDLPDYIHKNQTHALTILFSALFFLVRGPFLDSMVHIPDPTLALFFIAGVTFFYITTILVFIEAKSYFSDRLLLKNY
ncbi:MAG: hypothetical protein H8E32_06200 [Nitrospinae bacterium]|nr:hypothetical protein [Nitrospinota bacterium]